MDLNIGGACWIIAEHNYGMGDKKNVMAEKQKSLESRRWQNDGFEDSVDFENPEMDQWGTQEVVTLWNQKGNILRN